jgi:hypothetical protein
MELVSSLAIRKPHGRMNYEPVRQAKIRPEHVPTVLHSPHPHHLTDFAVVELGRG